MLSAIKIQGFKCFDEVDLTLGNLTLLTGVNSAGKSSVIQALLLLLQQENEAGNPLNGKYVRLGRIQDIKNWNTNPKQICIEAVFDDDADKCRLEMDMDEHVQLDGRKKLQECDLVYLSADRIGAEDVYKQNLANEYRIGIHGEYAFDYLSTERLNAIKEPAFACDEPGINLGNQVDYWLHYIIGYNVTAERIGGTEVVRVSYHSGENGSREVKPRHVGTGVSYMANVITAALSCRVGSIFVVENPEIHLHPAAQSKLLEFFCYLAKRGLQIIVETHSDHIFNGIRKNIKKGNITPDQAKVYFFTQEEMRMTRTVAIEIDENGVIQNQKKGLFDQFDDDLDELLGL